MEAGSNKTIHLESEASIECKVCQRHGERKSLLSRGVQSGRSKHWTVFSSIEAISICLESFHSEIDDGPILIFFFFFSKSPADIWKLPESRTMDTNAVNTTTTTKRINNPSFPLLLKKNKQKKTKLEMVVKLIRYEYVQWKQAFSLQYPWKVSKC